MERLTSEDKYLQMYVFKKTIDIKIKYYIIKKSYLFL